MIMAYHSGDAGDCLGSLPLIRHLKGGVLVVGPHVGPGGPREPMTEARAKFLMPLIVEQSYITEGRYEPKPAGITHDISMFRAKCKYRHGESLVHWQGRHLRIEPRAVDLSPWLTVEPSNETHGKVIMARSFRYHSPKFPWRQLVDKHRAKAVFVGLPNEHASFTNDFGPVPYRPVEDALEMASLIAGSELFIGNQSCPCWLAIGLGTNLIQETCAHCPNSKVIRSNARYVCEPHQL